MGTDEAQARLDIVRERYPQSALTLLWEETSYTGALRYTVLLSLPPVGTVSLSLNPDTAVPWLLHWARHARENEVVRVNQETLSIEHMMASLDLLWEQTPIAAQLVDMCLMKEAAKHYRLQPAAAHLQQAMERFRQAHRLFTAASTQQWMAEHGLTHQQFETLLTGQAITIMLQERIATPAQIAAYWEQHPGAFDTVHLACMRLRHHDTATQLCAAIRAGEADFYEAAAQQFVAGSLRSHSAPFFATHVRRVLAPEQAAVFFSAPPGELVGPLANTDCWDIVRVLACQTAQWSDNVTRDMVKKAVFEEWLATQRQHAQIEWYWGTAPRT